MKKLFTVITFFLLTYQLVNGQVTWSKINPITADYLQDVHVFDDNHAVAVGAMGGIFRTTDAGVNWIGVASPVTDDLYDLFFINFTTGWAVGGTNLIKSTDGGASWNLQYSSFGGSILGVHFINSDDGWVCGSFGRIYKTTDGGSTWVVQNAGTLSYGWLFSIYFIDSNKGFAVGSNQSYAETTNGGSSWSITEMAGGGGLLYKSVYFTSSTVGWIVGANNPIKTTNGGALWDTDPTLTRAGFGNEIMHDIYFIGTSNGYIVGNNGKIAITNDGYNWTVHTIISGQNYYAVRFGNSNSGWIVGNGGVIQHTINGGSAWTSQAMPVTTNQLNGTFFIDSDNGWAVGNNGTVINTTNGGTSWTTIDFGTTDRLNAVFFSSPDVGYICGDGLFYNTNDGGTNWLSKSISYEYFSMKFVNDNIGWLVGSVEGGRIVRTTNRGNSWYVYSATVPMYDIDVLDATTLVAVGLGGVIERSEDGGFTWGNSISGTLETLYGVQFINPIIGYACGDNGTILKTITGGLTWFNPITTKTIPTTNSITDIHFLSPDEGWAVAGSETIYTSDGGQNWSLEEKFSEYDLKSIHFPNPSIGFRVGGGGNIHKATINTVGQPPACAINIFPLHCDIDIEIITNLEWTDGGGETPTGYKFYFGTNGGGTTTPTNLVNGTNLGIAFSYDPPTDLLYNTLYYWQIVPTNGNGDAQNCPIWSFITRKNRNHGGGGSSAPGYFFANSTPGGNGAPSQPGYSWIDPITNSHTEITSWDAGDDDNGYKQVSMGMVFPYFGINYATVYIGTNGFLSFTSGTTATGASATIPDPDGIENMIAVCLMDLDDDVDGKIYYGLTGGSFVVTWWHYYDKSSPEYITCQVILKSSGYIEFQYNDAESLFPLGPGIGNDALIGIEDYFGAAGIQYRNDGVGGPIFSSPLALCFGEDDSALPVELSAFTAEITGSKEVLLKWETATEVNNYGFEIQRSSFISGPADDGGHSIKNWLPIGFVDGFGNSNSPKKYSFIDKFNFFSSSIYYYRLKQIDTDGEFDYSEEIEVEIIPISYKLSQNYPNPFNPSTKISFSIPEKGYVKLSIFNVLGEHIADLVNSNMDAGFYEYTWNAFDKPSGIYFYDFSVNDFRSFKKMILIK